MDEEYSNLITKYIEFEPRSKAQENEFLEQLINTINDVSIDFEEKVTYVNFLVSGVRFKQMGIFPLDEFPR